MAKFWIRRVVAPLLFVVAASAISISLLLPKRSAPQVVEEELLLNENYNFISAYDDIFKEVGAACGIDWVLLAAIARSESEFKSDAISSSGAVGLMQIMPRVAANMGVEYEELFDAKRNVEVAAELLHSIDVMFRFDKTFGAKERLCFTLAAYNAGYSRIADARRLARYFEDDDSSWEVVASYLEMLCEEEYFELEVVKGGSFYGSDETISYVKKVMRIYDRYQDFYICP